MTIIPHHLLTTGLPVRTDRPVFLNRLIANNELISTLRTTYKKIHTLKPFTETTQPHVPGLDFRPTPHPTFNKIGILVNGSGINAADVNQPITLDVYALLLITQTTSPPPENYILEDQTAVALPIGLTSVVFNTITLPPVVVEPSTFVTNYNLLGYSELELKTAIPESGYESVVLYAKLNNVDSIVNPAASLLIHLTGY
ncbi:MAG: hypothetical protein KatS3mg087_0462 [Patescibacteria group bacterium]|nr:MAG: hypothetical protein KatS3mg087_0462 [Patescibacteria group bacterium]